MTETQEKSPFVTIESLAQYFCVSVSTIRAWVRQGHIPETTYIKLGNTYRFNRAAVEVALMGMHKEGEEATQNATVAVERCIEGSGTVHERTHVSDNRQLEFDFDADEDA
jgi:excisionase family DNA binding protein